MSPRELTSQYLRIPTLPPLTNHFPSGLNATQTPSCVSLLQVSKSWPVRAFHILSKPLKSTEAICRPSGLNVIENVALAPSNKVFEEPSRRDQMRTRDPSPATRKWPLGEKQRDSIEYRLFNVNRFRFLAISHNYEKNDKGCWVVRMNRRDIPGFRQMKSQCTYCPGWILYTLLVVGSSSKDLRSSYFWSQLRYSWPYKEANQISNPFSIS